MSGDDAVDAVIPGEDDDDGNSSGHGGEAATFTLDEAIDELGFGPFQVVLLIITGMAWLADSMEMMLLSFLGPLLRCRWTLTPQKESLLTTMVFLGMMIGNNFWGFMADRFGRKRVMILSGVFILAFGVLSAFTVNIGELSAARFFVGFGAGGVHVAFAMFLEFVPTLSRGRWSTIMQGWWTLGTFIQALMAMLVLPSLGWRWLVALSALPSALFLLSAFFVPESPRYLISTGSPAALERTMKVLIFAARVNRRQLPTGRLDDGSVPVDAATANGASCEPADAEPAAGNRVDGWIGRDEDSTDSEDTDGDEEDDDDDDDDMFDPRAEAPRARRRAVAATKTAAPPRKRRRLSYSRSLRKTFGKKYLATTLLLLVIWFISALAYYGWVLLTTTLRVEESGGCEAADESGNVLQRADFVNVIVTSVAELPGLLVSALLIDVLGRRRLLVLLYLLAAVAGFCMLIPLRALRLVELFASRAAITGAFLVIYTYTPEVYSTSIRATAFGLCVAFSRVGGLTAPFVGQALIDYGRSTLAFIILSSSVLLAAVLSIALPVETRGASLSADGFQVT